MPLATQAQLQNILSLVGFVSQGDDDGDGFVSTTEELAWVTMALKQGDIEVYKRLLRRYKPAVIQNSSMAIQFAAICSAATYCRHRGDSVPESLQEWEDDAKTEMDAIREKKADLQAGLDDGGDLAPDRAAALPLLINQGFDPRFQRPSRRQVLQSTKRKSTKPYAPDYRDNLGTYQ